MSDCLCSCTEVHGKRVDELLGNLGCHKHHHDVDDTPGQDEQVRTTLKISLEYILED